MPGPAAACPTNKERYNVVVVGGGATCVALLARLRRRITRSSATRLAVTIVERRSALGPGLIYSFPDRGCRLNFDAPAMGILPDMPEDFQKWLTDNDEQLWPKFAQHAPRSRFPSRMLYGLYLTQRCKEQLAELRKLGVSVAVHLNTDVIAVRQAEFFDYSPAGVKARRRFIVSLRRANDHPQPKLDVTVDAWSVVLATGHMRASSARFSHLELHPLYFDWPYPPYQGLPLGPTSQDAVVAVVGNQSSACEVLNLLVHQGFQGTLRSFSRTGYTPHVTREYHDLPQPRSDDFKHDQKQLQALYWDMPDGISSLSEPVATARQRARRFNTLDGTLSWLAAQLRRAGCEEVNLSADAVHMCAPSHAYQHLRQKQQRVSGHKPPLPLEPFEHVIAQGLSTHVPEIWRRWSEEDQRRFLAKFAPYWMSYVTGITQENARLLTDRMEKGQLTMHSGLQSITTTTTPAGTKKFRVVGQGYNLLVDAVVNATGRTYDISRGGLNAELYRQMQSVGLLTPHPLGGVYLDPSTCEIGQARDINRVDRWGSVPGLLAVSPTLLKGELYHTAHIGVMMRYADVAAVRISMTLEHTMLPLSRL